MLTSIKVQKVINKYNSKNIHPNLKKIVNTSDMNVNRLIASCKPLACSNSTIHLNAIIIITNIEYLQVLKFKK